MKTNAVSHIILYSILLLLLIAVLVLGIVGKNWNFGSIGETISGSGTADASQIRNLHIEWASGNIFIHPADVTEITFSEEGYGSHPMAYQISGDTLNIRFTDTWFTLGNFSDKDLTVSVPKDWVCNELEVDMASADLTVKNLTMTTTKIDSASGAVRFENCQVKTMEADVASGNVYFSGIAEQIDFDAASGDFWGVFSETPLHMQFDVASGDVDITLPENAGFRAEVNALSGSFSSEFATIQSGNTYSCGDEGCRIVFDGASGDMMIRKSK